jgi:hypothetical protein
MDSEITIALIAFLSSVFGGLLVAIVNHLFTRKKTEAEIENLKALTKKTLAEAERISGDTKHALSEANYYDTTKLNEEVLYDGTKGMSSYDLTANFDEYDIKQGVILFQNNDWASYVLRTYRYDGKELTFIPKNEVVSGYRNIHASGEFKVINASYNVNIFLWETPEPLDGTDPSIDDRIVTITDMEWRKIDFYFRASPDRNYLVEIGTERVSGDGSLQMRNLIVAERLS